MKISAGRIYMSVASPWRFRIVQRSMPISKFKTIDEAIRTANRYERFVRYLLWRWVEPDRIWRQIKYSDNIFLLKCGGEWFGYIRLHNKDLILKADDMTELIAKGEGLVHASRPDEKMQGDVYEMDPGHPYVAPLEPVVARGPLKVRRMSSRPIDYFQGRRLPVGITVRELASRPEWYTVVKMVSGRVKRSVNVQESEVLKEIERFSKMDDT